MGTFHNDKGELHGITVVVDTDGPEVFVGRCHEVTAAGVVLLDVDVHSAEAGEGDDAAFDQSASKAAWVRRAARFGVWGRHRHLVVPRDRVASIRRLGDVAAE
ncbi:MAG TPA: hypothetical protein VFS60_08350 [Thermoanaerobaculia bacterium]|nr:hypothetical protein [Thermoanaerobaculia bacterium]